MYLSENWITLSSQTLCQSSSPLHILFFVPRISTSSTWRTSAHVSSVSCKVTSLAKFAWLSPADISVFSSWFSNELYTYIYIYASSRAVILLCSVLVYCSSNPPLGCKLSKCKDRFYSSVYASKHTADTQQNTWMHTHYFLRLNSNKPATFLFLQLAHISPRRMLPKLCCLLSTGWIILRYNTVIPDKFHND